MFLIGELNIRVETYLKSNMKKRGELLADYFSVVTLNLKVNEDTEENVTKKKKALQEVFKTGVVCNDVGSLFMLIANLRGYQQPMCKVGLDG